MHFSFCFVCFTWWAPVTIKADGMRVPFYCLIIVTCKIDHISMHRWNFRLVPAILRFAVTTNYPLFQWRLCWNKRTDFCKQTKSWTRKGFHFSHNQPTFWTNWYVSSPLAKLTPNFRSAWYYLIAYVAHIPSNIAMCIGIEPSQAVADNRRSCWAWR